jgi:hypothetical protein
VEAPFLTAQELVRPWRRATIIAGAIAAVELMLLLGAGALIVARPLSHSIQRHAVTAAAASSKPAAAHEKKLHQAIRRMHAPPGKAKSRSQVHVMVFNGNGQQGAAGSTAGHLQHLGYRISGTANAAHQNYASSVVMYVPGYRSEGLRLAKDMGVKVVGPLDGIGRSALDGAQLVVIVGA